MRSREFPPTKKWNWDDHEFYAWFPILAYVEDTADQFHWPATQWVWREYVRRKRVLEVGGGHWEYWVKRK